MALRLRYSALALMCCVVVGAPRALTAPAPETVTPRLLAYRLTPGETLRYKLTANVQASVPLFGNPTPIDLHAIITLVYLATPRTLLADGTSDVEFRVESAEVEIGNATEKIPLPLEMEQVQDVLNQTVTLSKTGEVKKVQGGGQLPFDVSVPGVDPKRLYTLLFPVVFLDRPVKPGDRWTFKSELLGGEGTRPTFSATVLPSNAGAPTDVTPIRENFAMDIDQRIDAEKRPVTGRAKVHKTRKGRIEGSGLLQFDRAQGRFTRGDVQISASIKENLIGKPRAKDEPKQIHSKVKAKVSVVLQPAPAPSPNEIPAKEKETP